MIWLLSIISGIFYRLGGIGDPFSPKIRDVGCSLLTCLVLYLHGYKEWIPLVCVFGLSWGAISTYWDWLFKDKDNFYMHGFMIGLALLPCWFFGMSLWLILTRAMVMGLGMGLLNKYVNKWQIPHSDWVEEFSRGSLILLTIPILML